MVGVVGSEDIGERAVGGVYGIRPVMRYGML